MTSLWRSRRNPSACASGTLKSTSAAAPSALRPKPSFAEEERVHRAVVQQLASGAGDFNFSCNEYTPEIGELEAFAGILLDDQDRPAFAALKIIEHLKYHGDEARLEADRRLVH